METIERLEEIPYIENDVQKGVKVNWKEVFSYYKGLGCPSNVYDPTELPMDKAAWFVLTSERNTGKTTNLILVMMILWLRYGCVGAYLRSTPAEITPKELQNFFGVILANHYIEKMTGGKYDGVRYWARYFRLVKWNEDGTRAYESEPMIWVGSVIEHERYKSVLNLPTCQMLIYDEFISENYYDNTFVDLNQLHKTIGRKRKNIKTFLCANTTNYYHDFFRELLIQEEVLQCKLNQSFIKKTPLGTCVYFKWIGDKDPEREELNMEYYGFDNPLLKSITGGDWALKQYPHIEREDREVFDHTHYIRFMERWFQLELVWSERLGLHVLVHRANEPKREKDWTAYVLDEVRDKRERYRFGSSKLDKRYWELYDSNKWYYPENDTGFSVESYVKRADKL